MTGSTLMTAACDSSSTCCSRLKQDTHILRLNFQIFSIKKILSADGTRLDLDIVPRQDESVQSTHSRLS